VHTRDENIAAENRGAVDGQMFDEWKIHEVFLRPKSTEHLINESFLWTLKHALRGKAAFWP
jgi:hypothetical protein